MEMNFPSETRYKNNVIQFQPDDWYTMRELRASVRYMQETNPKKYDLPLKKETECFKELLKQTARAA